IAARHHEAPRRAVRRGPDHPQQGRPNRHLPNHPGADGASDELARPLRALLDRATRSARRISGGRPMATKPSLVLKRRIKAAPEKVYEAWTKPEQMTHWWGGGSANPRKPIAETDLR